MQLYSQTPEHKVTINDILFVLKSFSLFNRRQKLSELHQLQQKYRETGKRTTEDYAEILSKVAEFIINVEGYENTPLQFLKEEIIHNNDLGMIIDYVTLHGILTEEQLKNLHSSSVLDTIGELVGSVTKDVPLEQEPVSEETPVEN